MFCASGCDGVLNARDISQLVFAGVPLEVCVSTSMRETNDRGCECLLVTGAMESYFPQLKAATISHADSPGGHRRLDGPVRNTEGSHEMNDISDEDLKTVIDSMGKALGLPVREDNFAVVEAHLRVAFKMADYVSAFPLPDDAEPAPVFSA